MSIDEIVINHWRRLLKLEARAAIEGLATPPEVQTEIEDIRRLLAGETTPMTVAVPPFGPGDVYNVGTLRSDVADAEATIVTHSTQIQDITVALGRASSMLTGMMVLSGVNFFFVLVLIVKAIFHV